MEKNEIENYLLSIGQGWQVDSTNESKEYARNAIRMEVIPVLKKINTAAVKHISETAKITRGLNNFIDSHIRLVLKMYLNAEGGLDKQCFEGMDEAMSLAVIHRWISGLSGDAGLVHARAVLDLLDKQAGRRVDIPGGFYVESTYDRLHIRRREEEKGYEVGW